MSKKINYVITGNDKSVEIKVALNHRITIQQQTNAINNWINIAKLWAFISPAGSNYIENNAEITHVIYIRYNNNIKINQKVLFQNRYFIILGIIHQNEEKKITILTAKEIVNNRSMV